MSSVDWMFRENRKPASVPIARTVAPPEATIHIRVPRKQVSRVSRVGQHNRPGAGGWNKRLDITIEGIVAAFEQGISAREQARVLGVTEITIIKRVSRARLAGDTSLDRLRKCPTCGDNKWLWKTKCNKCLARDRKAK